MHVYIVQCILYIDDWETLEVQFTNGCKCYLVVAQKMSQIEQNGGDWRGCEQK